MSTWFGPLFALMGLLFGSTKTVTTFDPDTELIHRAVWRFFFWKSEESLSFSSVENITTSNGNQKNTLAVHFHLDDGRKLSLGSFGQDQARAIARECEQVLALDEKLREERQALSQNSLTNIPGLKWDKQAKSHRFVQAGVDGSFPLSLTLFLLSPLLLYIVARFAPHIPQLYIIATIFPLMASAIAWRRSRPVTLEIHQEKGLVHSWPSLLGPDRTKIAWSELFGVAVEEKRVNRRFRALPCLLYTSPSPRD